MKTRSNLVWIVAAALLASVCLVAFGGSAEAAQLVMAIGPAGFAYGMVNAATEGAEAFLDEKDLQAFTVAELDTRIRAHRKVIDSMRNDARNDGREPTARETKRLEEAGDSLAMFEAELETRPEAHQSRAQVDAGAARPSGRKTDPDGKPGAALNTAAAAREGVVFAAGTRDFSARLFGAAPAAGIASQELKPAEFFNAVATRTFHPGLIRNATGTEGVGVDGGFDVPTIWYRGVIDQALQASEFAQRCRVFPAESNSLVIPMIDSTNRNAGVAGLLAGWAAENEELPAQVLKWIAKSMKLKKVAVLSEASSELVEDGIDYEKQLTGAMSLAIAQRLDAAILYGSGGRDPLGIVNSPGAIQIAKEAGQTADTVVFKNLVAMYTRLTPAAQKKAIWFVSPNVLPSLMAVETPGTGAPALLSGGFNDAAAGAPAMSIWGRPVVVTEIAGQVGDVGDVVFADMSQYGLLMKKAARMENSNAPGFNRDVISFRMIMRVDGIPLWSSEITPYNGGPTLTWATYLAARA